VAINVTARLEKKKKQLDGMLAKRRTMEEQIRQIQEEMKGLTNERLKQWTDALQMELERKNSAIDLTCVPVEKVAEWLLSYYGDRRSTRLEEAVLETSVHETVEKNPSDDVSQALTSEETFRSESAMQ
jgi:hypothetical protein